MKTIYKYKLEITDEQTIKMPAGAEVISAVNHNGELFVYAIIDTLDRIIYETEEKAFRIYGTGNPVNHELHCKSNDKPGLTYWRFVDTVTFGRLVWHVFVNETNDWEV